MATAGVEIYGVKEAIKELKTIDPVFRKQLNKDAKQVASPVVDNAKSRYPANYLSGMKYQWAQRGTVKFPYDLNKAQKGVGVKVDTGKKNEGTIVIMQKDPAAAIIDMTGKRGGQGRRGENFVNQMSRFGPPSRVMWPAWETAGGDVEQNMVALIETVMEIVNRNMVTA